MRVELVMNGSVLHGCDKSEIRGEFSIGRSSACNWPVSKDQIKISSRHALLSVEGGTVVYRDLDSTNGSFLHGEKITRHVLKPGDEIHLGDCIIRLAGITGGEEKSTNSLLRIRSGPLSGQTYILVKAVCVVGSDAAADVSIRDPMLSKHHAVLEHGPGGWSIKDLGSTNGTFVNGKRLENSESHALGRDGRFHLAHHGFVIESPGSSRKKVLMAGIGGAVVFGLIVLALLIPKKKSSGDHEQTPPGSEPKSAPPAEAKNTAPWTQGLESERPDFDLIQQAAKKSGSPEEIKTISSLAETYARWEKAENLLAGSDFAGFGPASRDITFTTEIPALKDWVSKLEMRRRELVELASLVPGLSQEIVKLGRPLWETPEVVTQIVAADALAVRPAKGESAPEGGAYGKWLGSQTTFKRLFESAGKITFTPLPSSPEIPLADRWKSWLEQAARADELASRHKLPAGPLRGQIDLMQTTRKGRDGLVRSLLADAVTTPGRAGLIKAIIASRISDTPSALQIDEKALPDWIKIRFTEVLDATENLQNAIDAAGEADKPSLLAKLLREGLPGDTMVNRAWREVPSP